MIFYLNLIPQQLEHCNWDYEGCVHGGPIGATACPSIAYPTLWHLWLPRTPTEDELKALQTWLFLLGPQREQVQVHVPQRWHTTTKAMLEALFET